LKGDNLHIFRDLYKITMFTNSYFLYTWAKKVSILSRVNPLIHHLLVNQEIYEEEGRKSKRDAPIPNNKNPTILTIEDMIQCIAQAGYEVKKINSGVDG